MAPGIIDDGYSGGQNPQTKETSQTPRPEKRYGKPLGPNWVPLDKVPARTPSRKLRVVTIGAGISGMHLAYKIYHEHHLEDVIEYVIYEANAEMGGTWLVNTYPGVACDIPAHKYTFPFEPNPEWSTFYASGSEIHAYLMRTVKKYDLGRGVRCNHRVVRAAFDENRGQWDLRIQHGDEVIEDVCDVLISATGFLSQWRWPSIEGIETFKGQLMHSARWPKDYDPSNKRIAVIGNGSSAIQIFPELVQHAAQLTNVVRSPTWIVPGLGSGAIEAKVNHNYTEEEKKRFREDPKALHAYRKKIQHGSNEHFASLEKGSQAQKETVKPTREFMLERLGGDEKLAVALMPDWEVGCRRATPGPGYLESFTKENVSLVTSHIEKIVPEGIRTVDRELHHFDVVVCATGFNVSHRPPWPLIGRHGITLAEQWKDEPEIFVVMFSGPNAPVGHGSLLAGLGWSADWMCQWFTKMAEEDIKFVDVRPEVVDDFNTYAVEIMETLVWSGGCRSWYKNHRVNGKVTAVWAGSALHYREMIDHIRPEDFEIRYRSPNRFRFMGNGRTRYELTPGSDLAFYLTK